MTEKGTGQQQIMNIKSRMFINLKTTSEECTDNGRCTWVQLQLKQTLQESVCLQNEHKHNEKQASHGEREQLVRNPYNSGNHGSKGNEDEDQVDYEYNKPSHLQKQK